MALLGTLRGIWSETATGGRWFRMQRVLTPSSQERTVAIFSPASGPMPSSTGLASGFSLHSDGGIFGRTLSARLLPWQMQQVRTKARGNEYQPKNMKRIRTHGWLKRLSTRGGIEVILRRMLKGRQSLSH
ncbi:large ribosomal subunit protein bL34m [Ambystoma mexicanum]|uniref:large ribosomal subunit protein bL34m n=1 Tax=Ambystoma mexicanum TaxID=8296 RepID=UPI0037E83133